MRIAALAIGVVAGFIASLILALGGLDVAADMVGADPRQVQAMRFGLFIVANVGIFGAALALAASLAGGIVMAVAALAWIAAALMLQRADDLMLMVMPALLLVAAGLAIAAHFRRLHEDSFREDPYRRAPRRRREPVPLDPEDEDEPEFDVPEFGDEPPMQPVAAAFAGPDYEDEIDRPRGDEWNPRRRPPPPPRARAAFRDIEVEEDEYEPSWFASFSFALSSILSFGLYAALAGAGLLVAWNFSGLGSDRADQPQQIAEAAAPVLADPAAGAAPASPVLAAQPPAQPLAAVPEVENETSDAFSPAGEVMQPDDSPLQIPRLADDFFDDLPMAQQLPALAQQSPEALPETTEAAAPAAQPAETAPPPAPTAGATSAPRPMPMTPAMAAARAAPSPSPAPPAQPAGTGLQPLVNLTAP